MPYLDADDLPLLLAVKFTLKHRHPLGKGHNFHAPPDYPSDHDEMSTDDEGTYKCPGAYFMKCSDACVLCRGCVDEDWLLLSKFWTG